MAGPRDICPNDVDVNPVNQNCSTMTVPEPWDRGKLRTGMIGADVCPTIF